MSCEVIVYGAYGMLGKAVSEKLSKNQFEVIRSSRKNGIDITVKDDLEAHIRTIQPDIIINCAAVTDVEKCEDPDFYPIAEKVNGFVPGHLAEICLENKIMLIHISTDYVFGENLTEGYREDHSNFKAVNAYGTSKLIGEKKIIERYGGAKGSNFVIQKPRAYLVRTQWLFGPSAKNFISKILELARKQDYLTVVEDEIGCPVYVGDVARDILYLLTSQPPGGIYHSCPANSCSRYDFAAMILKQKNIMKEIRPTSLKQFDRKAPICHYSILRNTKLPSGEKTWQEMLAEHLG